MHCNRQSNNHSQEQIRSTSREWTTISVMKEHLTLMLMNKLEFNYSKTVFYYFVLALLAVHR